MQLIRDLSELPSPLGATALSIGNFDGIHLGHAKIIHRLKKMASEISGHSVVFTFDPHPAILLRPDFAPQPLTSTDRKAAILASLGVDLMVVYPTDQALLNLEPDVFFEKIVLHNFDTKAMVEGPNFQFGKNRAGDTKRLQKLGQKHQMQIEIIEPLVVDDEFISSSRIRKLIAQGDLVAANRMLTCRYRIRGKVSQGAGRGASLGFPTANLEAIETLLPGEGVYAARAFVEPENQSNTIIPAAVNIGPNPTFGESALKVEAHLVGFEQTLYGKWIELEFYGRLRSTRTFEGIDQLKLQLQQDVQETVCLVQDQ